MLSDIVSYSAGKHQFRFGGEVRQGRVDEFYFRHSLGNYTFDGSQGPWSAMCVANDATCARTIALADFLAGYISTGNLSVGNAERKVTVNGFNLFAQDQWQVTRKLNLNLGLRYEYFGPLHNGNKDLAVFVPGRGLVIQGNGIDSIFPPDRNNFAPRFGLAYQPTARNDLVIRGGFGVYYDQININPFLDYRPPNGAADGLEGNPAGPSPVSSYSQSGLVIDPVTKLKTGTLFQWQPNVALFPGIETCPTGNCPGTGQTFGIYSVSQNINQAPLTGGPRPFATQYPNFGDINQLNSAGTSNYNSLQATFKSRSWHGLNTQLSYTWGHNLDEVTEYRGVIPLNSFDLKAEYGNADFDTRHNFTAAWVYEIPGASWGPKILTHGWQLTSLWSFHTGTPFNITGGTQRPGLDLIANPFAGVSHSFSAAAGGEPWVNPAAFCVPGAAGCAGPTNPMGDLSRNKYYGPSFKDFDFSIFKNFNITERVKLQLRGEIYNIGNHINLASGSGSVGSSGFVSDTIGDFNGAPGLGPGEPFNMQLVGKIIF